MLKSVSLNLFQAFSKKLRCLADREDSGMGSQRMQSWSHDSFHWLECAQVRLSGFAMSMLGGYGLSGSMGLGGSMMGTGLVGAPAMAAPVMTSQRMVDVHVPHVQTRAIPRVETQIVDRHVPRVEIQTVERVVEVPQVQIKDVVVEVPQIQEVIRHVPKVEIQEVVREVTRIEIQTVDREVEVLLFSTTSGFISTLSSACLHRVSISLTVVDVP